MEPMCRLGEGFSNPHASRSQELEVSDSSVGRTLPESALGDVWLRTSVYVFDRLGEPMLPGASSIVKHGFMVNDASKLLHRSTPLQILPLGFVPLLSSHAGMKDSPRVQIIAHGDKRPLCLVNATDPANVLSTINCTTEWRRCSSHRQLGRFNRRTPLQSLRNESRSPGDKRGGKANMDTTNEMPCLSRPGRCGSRETTERDSLPPGGRRRSGHEDDFDEDEKVDYEPEKQKAHLSRFKN
eukprot:6209501-Pleurochrysis_carterae.AAC.4